jgi:hypothetical protein
MLKLNIRPLSLSLIIPLIFNCITSYGDWPSHENDLLSVGMTASSEGKGNNEIYQPVNAILVLPKNPVPGEPFRILITGGENIRKVQISVSGMSGNLKSLRTKSGVELPYWRIDDFAGSDAGKYRVSLIIDKKVVSNLDFAISPRNVTSSTAIKWKGLRGWDSNYEAIYSAWINALFSGCDERSSWPALNEVTQNQNQNFLYNYLSLGEDDPAGKNRLIMQPDCADNPFYLRAYFSWKLDLPFGYHLCDRGSLVHNPKTGQWITNESYRSKNQPTLAFNAYLRGVMNGVHSGTARTALDDENSDYYPVSLEREALRPGIVFADPYGHTLILISWMPQSNGRPGLLLAVDAQPDGTVAVKRFWKGNFLFNTSGVVGVLF